MHGPINIKFILIIFQSKSWSFK